MHVQELSRPGGRRVCQQVCPAVRADAVRRDEHAEQVVIKHCGVVGGESARARMRGQRVPVREAHREGGRVAGQLVMLVPVRAGVVVGSESNPQVVAELWLTGAVRSLPYADHCRVLEEMFPGWTADQLFQPATADRPFTAAGASAAAPPSSVVLSTGMRPYIEQAFTREHVTIDFAGFSGETLHGVVQEPLDKIRTGQLKPASVTIRMLLPDTTRPMAVPCRVEDLADDPDYRARIHQITGRHAYAILESVQELTRLGRIREASTQIRAYQVPPLFKLYLQVIVSARESGRAIGVVSNNSPRRQLLPRPPRPQPRNRANSRPP